MGYLFYIHTHMPTSHREKIRLQASPTPTICQGIKMVFNGLPVLSAVLVCSTVLFGYVAPNTVPEVWDECEKVLHEVKSVKTCIRDVNFYRELAEESCSDSLVDWVTHDKIKVAIDERVCRRPEVGDECEDILDAVKNVKTCIRDVDFYLELADESCSDSLVDWLTHDKIKAAIDKKACRWD